MKFLYLKLVNYVGIYNGLGQDEIDIDFTKMKSKLVLIRGLNGSGKSTINKSLSPLPDSNKSILNGKQGEKYINILNNNAIYKIKIIHPVNTKGDRSNIKCFIMKSIDDEHTELNPNGNYRSFRDTVYTEFGLDSNFEALSRLSTEDRGIADKEPAQRKKFVNDILVELQDYNNIYKAISKRSTLFKATMNRLESKIGQIGDAKILKPALQSIEHRIGSMNKERDSLNMNIANIIAEISSLDPDGSIQSKSDKAYIEMQECNIKIKEEYEYLSAYRLSDYDKDNIKIEIDKASKESSKLKIEINNLEETIDRSLLEREEDAKAIQIKSQRLNSLMSETNYNELKSSIDNLTDSIKEWESILTKMGYDINQEINLTKDEYLLGINTLKDIKELISTFRSSMDYKIIESTIKEYIYKNNDPVNDYNICKEKLSIVELHISDIEKEVIRINSELKVMNSLNLKPEECSMYNCAFIAEAYSISRTEPQKRLKDKEEEFIKYNRERAKYLVELNIIEDILECHNYISRMIRLIGNNNGILRKLPNSEKFSTKEMILDRIIHNDQFDEIVYLQKFVQYCDVFSMYSISKNKLYRLESDMRVFESKEDLISEITNDVTNLDIKLSQLDGQLEIIRTNLFEKRKISNVVDARLDTLIRASQHISLINILENNKGDALNKLSVMKESMQAISKLRDMLSEYQFRLKAIDADIIPLSEERDTLKFALKQLKEYTIEYKQYHDSYSMIQEIKLHSSPTKGIQLVFIELYMSNMINLANNLLAMLFDGEYFIEPFIINEKEFRIPCRGSGAINDDITSMSTGQISMISMVLSFVMLKQSSTDYNILKLDEIDAGLDSINRVKFLNLLDKQMNLLDVEQCIMISHNPELDISGCDMILLKMDESEKVSVTNSGANIIYSY